MDVKIRLVTTLTGIMIRPNAIYKKCDSLFIPDEQAGIRNQQLSVICRVNYSIFIPYLHGFIILPHSEYAGDQSFSPLTVCYIRIAHKFRHKLFFRVDPVSINNNDGDHHPQNRKPV